jgi:cobaltochelatase CobN
MLESVRKGYWQATPEQIKELANLHTTLVNSYDAGCSGFVCDNTKLQHFIEKQINNNEHRKQYASQIKKVREVTKDQGKENVVLRKETQDNQLLSLDLNTKWVLAIICFVVILLVVFIKRRRK